MLLARQGPPGPQDFLAVLARDLCRDLQGTPGPRDFLLATTSAGHWPAGRSMKLETEKQWKYEVAERRWWQHTMMGGESNACYCYWLWVVLQAYCTCSSMVCRRYSSFGGRTSSAKECQPAFPGQVVTTILLPSNWSSVFIQGVPSRGVTDDCWM